LVAQALWEVMMQFFAEPAPGKVTWVDDEAVQNNCVHGVRTSIGLAACNAALKSADHVGWTATVVLAVKARSESLRGQP
jgi:hypothetical protein